MGDITGQLSQMSSGWVGEINNIDHLSPAKAEIRNKLGNYGNWWYDMSVVQNIPILGKSGLKLGITSKQTN